MLHINPANGLNMLIVSFQISNIPQTLINKKEIELHDTIKHIAREARTKIVDDLKPLHLRFFRCRVLQT